MSVEAVLRCEIQRLGIINDATVHHFRHQLFKSVPSVMTVAQDKRRTNEKNNSLPFVSRVRLRLTDPTLTAAVATQTEILKKIFKTRDKTQKEIIATEVAVTAAMERMHQLEKKMLEYLQNAQGAMQNIYQIKRAAELVAVEIPNNMSLLRKSLPGHLKGTAIALMVSDELADATTQMITLFPFMKQLVTSGAQLGGTVLYSQRGCHSLGDHQHGLVAAGMADPHAVMERSMVRP